MWNILFTKTAHELKQSLLTEETPTITCDYITEAIKYSINKDSIWVNKNFVN